MSDKKLWAGRFNEPTDAFVEAFTASVEFDQRLYHYDIAGSIAHARMLAHAGILSAAERDAIVAGLQQIAGQIELLKAEMDVLAEQLRFEEAAEVRDRIYGLQAGIGQGRDRSPHRPSERGRGRKGGRGRRRRR